MYWPIGAPRIYAASNSNAPNDRLVESDDDAESREPTDNSGSLVDGQSISTGTTGEDNTDLQAGILTPTTPVTPGIKPVELENQQQLSARSLREFGSNTGYRPGWNKESILCLRVSRTGHLVASITETSLTIWQTKVSLLVGSTKFSNI